MWVLKEEGVLRIKSVKHHVVGQKTPPTEYTIMENVVSFWYFLLENYLSI